MFHTFPQDSLNNCSHCSCLSAYLAVQYRLGREISKVWIPAALHTAVWSCPSENITVLTSMDCWATSMYQYVQSTQLSVVLGLAFDPLDAFYFVLFTYSSWLNFLWLASGLFWVLFIWGIFFSLDSIFQLRKSRNSGALLYCLFYFSS
jgi:hypothetical protein